MTDTGVKKVMQANMYATFFSNKLDSIQIE